MSPASDNGGGGSAHPLPADACREVLAGEERPPSSSSGLRVSRGGGGGKSGCQYRSIGWALSVEYTIREHTLINHQSKSSHLKMLQLRAHLRSCLGMNRASMAGALRPLRGPEAEVAEAMEPSTEGGEENWEWR